METETVNGFRHYKTPQGLLYPSVTTVLKHLSAADIAKWKARVGEVKAEEVSAKASLRGNNIHEMCEHYLLNDFEHTRDKKFEFDAYTFDKMKPFLNRIDNIRGLEMALYSDKLRIAGRTDCIAEYNGVLSVIDFKTSLREKKKCYVTSYFIQETAYAVMYEELTGTPIKQIVTLIANDEGHCAQEYIEKADDWKYPLRDAIVKYRKILASEINV